MDLNKNNLKNMRTYLIGAIDRVPDGGKTWRDNITPFLESLGVTVLNPCNKPIESAKENDETRNMIEQYKATGQYHKIRKEFSHIRNADLRCVDVSDFVVAHIDTSIHACGSYEEIVTANRQKKPILVWCEQGKRNAPNWLFFMLPHEYIFDSMDDLMKYLNFVNQTENNQIERWFFFT